MTVLAEEAEGFETGMLTRFLRDEIIRAMPPQAQDSSRSPTLRRTQQSTGCHEEGP